MRRWWIAVSTTMVGCNLVAGFPDYELVDADPAAGGGPGATASSTGGTVVSSTSSSGAGGQGGATGGGGEGGCQLAADCTSPFVCKAGTCQPAAVWSKRYGAAGEQEVNDLAVARDGAVGVVGSDAGGPFFWMLDVGGNELTSSTWMTISNSTTEPAASVAWVGSGTQSAVVVGTVDGSITTTSTLTSSGDDVFFHRITQGGTVAASELLGGASNEQAPIRAAVSDDKDMFVRGRFITNGYSFPPSFVGAGTGDYLAKIDPFGGFDWVTSHDGFGAAMVAPTEGEVVQAGLAISTIDIGGTSIPAGRYLARFGGDAGDVIWAKPYEGGHVTGLAVLPGGDIVMSGALTNAFSADGVTAMGPGTHDAALLARFRGSDGAAVWVRVFDSGDIGDNVDFPAIFSDVAVDGDGNILAVGYFTGTIDFGGGPLTSVSPSTGRDVMIASFDADGNHRYSQRFGDISKQRALAVDHDRATGGFVMAGEFVGTADFGAGDPLEVVAGQDVFVVQLAP